MHKSRINTFAAIGVVLFFGLGAVGLIERAIMQVNWQYAVLAEAGIQEF
jgi:hypothetical protein